MTAHPLAALPRYGEHRGTLTYMVGHEAVAFAGWVAWSADGSGVIARRYRGRNRWLIASAANVVGFTPHAAVEVTR
jgi:hypothetical protein